MGNVMWEHALGGSGALPSARLLTWLSGYQVSVRLAAELTHPPGS